MCAFPYCSFWFSIRYAPNAKCVCLCVCIYFKSVANASNHRLFLYITIKWPSIIILIHCDVYVLCALCVRFLFVFITIILHVLNSFSFFLNITDTDTHSNHIHIVIIFILTVKAYTIIHWTLWSIVMNWLRFGNYHVILSKYIHVPRVPYLYNICKIYLLR